MAPLAAVVGLAMTPTEGGVTVCPFALITGQACPGCGLTRAAASLVQGDVSASLAFHPLVMVVLAWLIGAWAVAMARRSGHQIRLDPRLVNGLLAVTAGLFVVVWVGRFTTGTLPVV